jgi:uncharacterized protein (TIGR02265 family)
MAAPPYLSSSVGKVLLMANQKNPKLLINSLPTAYRAAVSYGECSVRWTDPGAGCC